MAGVPYIFGNATTSIPLTNLDANFNTGLTIGNTTVGLGNTVTTLGNVTLTNTTISSPSGIPANAVIYSNTSGNLTGNTSVLTVKGANLGIGISNPTQPLQISGGVATEVDLFVSGTRTGTFYVDNSQMIIDAVTAIPMVFKTSDTEAMRIDSSGNVGIATTGPNARLDVEINSANGANALNWTTGNNLQVGNNDTTYSASSVAKIVLNTTAGGYNNGGIIYAGGAGSAGAGFLSFATGWASNLATEKMRLASDGSVRIAMQNFAAIPSSSNYGVSINNTGAGSRFYGQGSGTETQIEFGNTNGTRGSIQTNATVTLYNTTSDYRLKENVVPMIGALNTVSTLKPCTYTWKVDGSNGQGFIAHELQEVMPDCVSGEKDAVDENGDVKPQQIDTSYLVATLTAAIQELKAIVDTQATQIAELQTKVGA